MELINNIVKILFTVLAVAAVVFHKFDYAMFAMSWAIFIQLEINGNKLSNK